MKLIVGLGNPGKEYKDTRHNVGFNVIDEVCNKLNVQLTNDKFNSLYYIGIHNNKKFIVMKPTTYMNKSGEAIIQLMNYYKIDLDNILVIYDDMDTELAQFKIRQKGGSGGQNGMKNIIAHFSSQLFSRIKIGIGKHQHINTIDYVLGKFNNNEKVEINKTYDLVSDACIDYIDKDINYIMNTYNKKR